MAPIVVKGKILVGNSGGELGVRGWVTALDENTGAIAWRAYSTGPDKDVLIGDDFKPFYDNLKGQDLGVKTWPADRWQVGGGTVWGWISYDPDLNLIYYGTANPSPWNANQRSGDNLWSTTIFARDPDTGRAKWAYQVNPHDLFDHDEINENVLVDLELNGQPRKVLIHPGRNGYMYVMDRATGEVISADAYDFVNTYKGVDLKTGKIIANEEKTPLIGKTVENICPSAPGAKDWQPTAWSPRTKLLYVPHQHLCMSFKASQVGYIAGTPLCRRRRRHVCRPRRVSRRVHGVGSRRAQEGLGDPRKAAGLERRAGDSRGCRVLRHHGSLVQSGGCEGWARALAIPCRLRVHRPADLLSRVRRTAIHRDPFGRRRLAGGGGERRGRSAGAQQRPWLYRCDAGFAVLYRRRERAAGVQARRREW
ncbi:hypothetical protein ACVWWK_004621 [Bradyrhizobium sp. LB9.1b]